MMKHKTYLLLSLLLTLLALFPEVAFAAESKSINPPGWLGGTLALLALALVIGVGIWVRNKQP